jgi:replicative DNA helicase
MKPSLQQQILQVLSAHFTDEKQLADALRSLLPEQSVEEKEPLPTLSTGPYLCEHFISFLQDENYADDVILTGYPSLDRACGGFLKGDLIVIGARPGMGKVSFMAGLSYRIASGVYNDAQVLANQQIEMMMTRLGLKEIDPMPSRPPIPGLFYSVRMSGTQMVHKFAFTLVSSARVGPVSAGDTFKNHIKALSVLLKDKPLYFAHGHNGGIEELEQVCKEYVAKYQIGVLYLDTLQDLKADRRYENREKEVRSLVVALKRIASTYNICVIVCSELNRSVEYRSGDKRPMISDFRDSGAIESMADKVLMLYRPEYYGLTETCDGHSTEGLMDITIGKSAFLTEERITLKRESCGFYFEEVDPYAEAIEVKFSRMDDLKDIF